MGHDEYYLTISRTTRSLKCMSTYWISTVRELRSSEIPNTFQAVRVGQSVHQDVSQKVNSTSLREQG